MLLRVNLPSLPLMQRYPHHPKAASCPPRGHPDAGAFPAPQSPKLCAGFPTLETALTRPSRTLFTGRRGAVGVESPRRCGPESPPASLLAPRARPRRRPGPTRVRTAAARASAAPPRGRAARSGAGRRRPAGPLPGSPAVSRLRPPLISSARRRRRRRRLVRAVIYLFPGPERL